MNKIQGCTLFTICLLSSGSSVLGCSSNEASTASSAQNTHGSNADPTVLCGNAQLDTPEGCDDGNTSPGDGCATDCSVEFGFQCEGEPSHCRCSEELPCEDGDPCTQSGVCKQNDCIGFDPVVCDAPLSECSEAGVCNSQSGKCDYPPKAENVACSEGFCRDGLCTSSTFSVRVLDKSGLPIPSAKVQLSGQSALTSSDGFVKFENVVPGRLVAQISAPLYAPASAVANVRVGVDVQKVVHLLPYGEPITFHTASGADIVKDKARVILPPNAVVDSNGQPVSGYVDMTIVPLDPSKDLDAMPGPLMGLSQGQALPVPLESVMMGDIALWKSGKQLKLKPGAHAQLEFLIPDKLQQHYNLGDTVPAWYFDMAQGTWLNEGTGTIISSAAEPGKLAWAAEVPHFSWWNADNPIDESCVKVKVVNSIDFTPIEGATVEIVSKDYDSNYIYSGTTSNTGFVFNNDYAIQECLPLKFNGKAYIKAYHEDYAGVVSYKIDQMAEIPGVPEISGNNQGSCSVINSTCPTVEVRLGRLACAKGKVYNSDLLSYLDIDMNQVSVIARYALGSGFVSEKAVAHPTDPLSYLIKVPRDAIFHLDTHVPAGPNSGIDMYSDDHTSTGLPPTTSTLEPNQSCHDIVSTPGKEVANIPDLILLCNQAYPTCESDGLLFGDDNMQEVSDIATDSDGNVFITGQFTGILQGLSGLQTVPKAQFGGEDIFVIKFEMKANSLPKALWAKVIGGMGIDRATSIAVDEMGNPIISGTFTQMMNVDGAMLNAVGGKDGFVLKLEGKPSTESPDALWLHQIGGLGHQQPVDLLVTPSFKNGNLTTPSLLAILGSFTSELSPCPSCGSLVPQPAQGLEDIFAIYLSTADGSFQAYNTFGAPGGTAKPKMGALAAANNATPPFNIYLTGSFDKSLTINNTINTIPPPQGLNEDIFVGMIYGSDLAAGWVQRFGDSVAPFNAQIAHAIAVDKSSCNSNPASCNEIWMTGEYKGCMELPGIGSTCASANSSDLFILKLNANGSPLWLHATGDSANQIGTDIVIDSPGHVIATGVRSGSIWPPLQPAKPLIGLQDMYLMELKSTNPLNVKDVQLDWYRDIAHSNAIVSNARIAIMPGSGPIAIGATVVGDIILGGQGPNIPAPVPGSSNILVGKTLNLP